MKDTLINRIPLLLPQRPSLCYYKFVKEQGFLGLNLGFGSHVNCSGTSLIWTPLRQEKVSLLVRCRDFSRVWDSHMYMYSNFHQLYMCKCALFIKVSSFQGVLFIKVSSFQGVLFIKVSSFQGVLFIKVSSF